MLDALQPVLARHDVTATDDELLELFARHESVVQSGVYLTYREVLAMSLRRMCADLGVDPADADVIAFAGSVPFWPAFPDSAAALRRLRSRFRLGVLTNCDDDLYVGASHRLGDPFDTIVTAQQARGYKPRPENFALLFERLAVAPDRILHVAQSLFHDHVPAKALGMTTVWIDRRHDKSGFGATPAADATPDLVVPDLKTLADLALA